MRVSVVNLKKMKKKQFTSLLPYMDRAYYHVLQNKKQSSLPLSVSRSLFLLVSLSLARTHFLVSSTLTTYLNLKWRRFQATTTKKLKCETFEIFFLSSMHNAPPTTSPSHHYQSVILKPSFSLENNVNKRSQKNEKKIIILKMRWSNIQHSSNLKLESFSIFLLRPRLQHSSAHPFIDFFCLSFHWKKRNQHQKR
jgi:hypothetical protein